METEEGRRIAALHAKWASPWEVTDPGSIIRGIELEAEALVLGLLRERVCARVPIGSDLDAYPVNAGLVIAEIDALMPRDPHPPG